MREKNSSKIFVFCLGVLAGVLATLLCVWLVTVFTGSRQEQDEYENTGVMTETRPNDAEYEVVKPEEEETDGEQTENPEAADSDVWDAEKVYNGGEIVSYNGKMYKCRWWTQGEEPGAVADGVWEDLMIADPSSGETVKPGNVENVPVDASTPKNADAASFKVVGYYPSWSPDNLNKVDFNVVTHVNYAFAIPNSDGSLKPLESPETAKALISSAHKNGAKALLAVGGWSYHETPLEPNFVSATENEEKREKFVTEIIKMCDEFGFDGIDMDWEHPRVDGNSAVQYEETMKMLAERLHEEGKLLTAAVLSGATPDGNIYYDAAAHTNAVLNAVDWINVMAYDGGDGERHSGYDFAVACGKYWKDDRGLPAEKVVLGVPFYGRPSWASYEKILEADSSADQKDVAMINGMEAHYNGIPTIQKKTKYAKENLGGIMIWELTQDTADRNKSLLQAIDQAAK